MSKKKKLAGRRTGMSYAIPSVRVPDFQGDNSSGGVTKLKIRALRIIGWLNTLPETPTPIDQATRFEYLGSSHNNYGPYFHGLLTKTSNGCPRMGRPKMYVVNRAALRELEKALKDAGMTAAEAKRIMK